nr:MAG TPA: hypothetical protein [Caudoviricetes sp.]
MRWVSNNGEHLQIELVYFLYNLQNLVFVRYISL